MQPWWGSTNNCTHFKYIVNEFTYSAVTCNRSICGTLDLTDMYLCSMVEDQGFLELLKEMLSDSNPIVRCQLESLTCVASSYSPLQYLYPFCYLSILSLVHSVTHPCCHSSILSLVHSVTHPFCHSSILSLGVGGCQCCGCTDRNQ